MTKEARKKLCGKEKKNTISDLRLKKRKRPELKWLHDGPPTGPTDTKVIDVHEKENLSQYEPR